MDTSKRKNVAAEWSLYPDDSIDVLEPFGSIMADDLTEFEVRVFEWIRQSDFEGVPWSTKTAAKSFKCSEDEIFEAVASLTKKVPTRIQIYYEDGNVHIAAE